MYTPLCAQTTAATVFQKQNLKTLKSKGTLSFYTAVYINTLDLFALKQLPLET
jgi:hypothetical protein